MDLYSQAQSKWFEEMVTTTLVMAGPQLLVALRKLCRWMLVDMRMMGWR